MRLCGSLCFSFLLWTGIGQAQSRLSVAGCQEIRKTAGYTGRFGWADAPEGALIGSSESRTTGQAELACRIKLPPGSQYLRVQVGRVHIGFEGQHGTGSGIVFEVRSGSQVIWTRKLLRVAGEDWVEQETRTERVAVPPTARRVSLLLRLIDVSVEESLRVDIEGIRYDPIMQAQEEP